LGVQQNQKNIKKFDQWSKTYDRGRMSHWLTDGQAKVLDRLSFDESDWFLDVGCGTGWAVIRTSQQVPGGKACGIDISPGMVARATELARGVPNVDLRVADAEAIPYPENTFSAIICTNSFHHYSTPVRAISEMRRVLKPGGQLLIRDSNRQGCHWVWLWDRFLRTFERGHVQYHTEREVLQFMEEAGIKQATLVNREHAHFHNGKIGSATYLVRGVKV
jgi:ubiquinone/menaquinone biosynthesis C-methylase UbiE